MTQGSVSLHAPASLADLEALPDTVRGEIIDGVLYTQPRPRPGHASILTSVTTELHAPFQLGRGGPGGWWILAEPGVTAPGSPEFVPDVAGWRRERLPRLPPDRISVIPDWICEVLSPGTRRYDLGVKRAFYARIGVGHLWYVDLDAEALTVSRLEGGRWLELGVHVGPGRVRLEPFAEVELDLATWWSELPGTTAE